MNPSFSSPHHTAEVQAEKGIAQAGGTVERRRAHGGEYNRGRRTIYSVQGKRPACRELSNKQHGIGRVAAT